MHLPLDHDFLQGLEHRFAFREREAERLGCQVLPFHTGDLLGRFLAIVGDRHHLDLDLHGRLLSGHTNACSCVLIARRSKWSGWNCLIRLQAVDRLAERVEIPQRCPDRGLRVRL